MKKNLLYLLAFAGLFLTACKRELSPTVSPTTFLATTTKDVTVDTNSVTLSTATQVGQGYLQARNQKRTVTVQQAVTITDQAGIPYMHVINAAGGGFVVLAATANYPAVLAYSDNGHFATTNPAPGVQLFLNRHATNIRQLRGAAPDSNTVRNKKTWLGLIHRYAPNALSSIALYLAPPPGKPNLRTDMLPAPAPTYVIDGYFTGIYSQGPYCTTQWGQGCGFNTNCPADGDNSECDHDVTGCVPMAMAQVMYYWKYPSSFDWADMNTSSAGTPAAAYLLNVLGQDLGVSYGDTNTSGDDTNDPGTFAVMGYPSVAISESILDQTLTGRKDGVSYATALFDEVYNNNRPCIIGGYSSENNTLGVVTPGGNGHEWVCDGVETQIYYEEVTWTYYKSASEGGGVLSVTTVDDPLSESIYFSMNWGWYGEGNGFYLTAGGPLSYSASTGYTMSPDGNSYGYFQDVITNIYPG